tara:strand:- start:374 stop:553 length:180 start_codon:yes stop_codon:yes gene_type:complete
LALFNAPGGNGGGAGEVVLTENPVSENPGYEGGLGKLGGNGGREGGDIPYINNNNIYKT